MNAYDLRHDSEARRQFARPGSALRRATRYNPRDQECPTCKTPNVLTLADRQRGYQCDACADLAEGAW